MSESQTPRMDTIPRRGPHHHYILDDVMKEGKAIESELISTRARLAELEGHQVIAITALRLAYALGHYCDDDPCPGCECGHALDKILGRIVSQEECEQFVEQQFKVKSNSKSSHE